MFAIDLVCLTLIVVLAVLSKQARRVAFHRKVVALGGAAAGAALTLQAAGQLGDIPAGYVALSHLFSAICFSTAAAIPLDRRISPVAAGYLAAFLVAAARPDLFYTASFVAHSLMAVMFVYVLGDR